MTLAQALNGLFLRPSTHAICDEDETPVARFLSGTVSGSLD
jgi:hypothetical protein